MQAIKNQKLHKIDKEYIACKETQQNTEIQTNTNTEINSYDDEIYSYSSDQCWNRAQEQKNRVNTELAN